MYCKSSIHTVLLCAALLSCAALRAAEVITLPVGPRVEGVTHARGSNFFAGDIFSGKILLVDVESELITTAVPASSRQSFGMYATAPGRLFVAGGGARPPAPPTRSDYLHVYDIPTGGLIATCNTTSTAGFVNDVVADHDYAYYTDSFLGRVYRLTIAKLPACEVQTIQLDPRFFLGEGFRANGIVIYRGGLLVANSALATLFFVDLKRGNKLTQVAPDGALPGVDGLAVTREASGVTLYVAQNRENKVSVWKLSFDEEERKAYVSPIRTIERPSFKGPSTVGVGGGYLVATNVNFAAGLNTTGPFTLTATKI